MTQYSKFTPDQWSVVMAPDIVAATETQNADEVVPALTNCFYNVATETFASGSEEKKRCPSSPSPQQQNTYRTTNADVTVSSMLFG